MVSPTIDESRQRPIQRYHRSIADPLTTSTVIT